MVHLDRVWNTPSEHEHEFALGSSVCAVVNVSNPPRHGPAGQTAKGVTLPHAVEVQTVPTNQDQDGGGDGEASNRKRQ